MKLVHLLALLLLSEPHISNANLVDDATQQLLSAAGSGDIENVRAALSQNPRLNERGGGGQTALMSSCLRGYADVALLLLSHGADINIGEKDGYTCLHGAGFQGRHDVAARVLEAYPNAPNGAHTDGFHPIHRACWGREQRHTNTVRAFLNAGVPHDIRTGSGETPLDISRRVGNKATEAVLVEAAGSAGERDAL